MTPLENRLAEALLANSQFREQIEELIAAYIEPGSNKATIINRLIVLLGGRKHRRARRLAEEALGEAQRAAK